MKTVKNAIQCLNCGSVIRKDTDYEYIPCACGLIAVDGGPHYVRVIGNTWDWKEVIVPDPPEEKLN